MGECIEWKAVKRFKKLYCKDCKNYNGVGCNACCDAVNILKCIRPVAHERRKKDEINQQKNIRLVGRV